MENQYLRQNCHQMLSIQPPTLQQISNGNHSLSLPSATIIDDEEKQNLLEKYMKENEILR